MLSGINNFSRSYFSPIIDLKHDDKPLKGLKIASYLTVVAPVAIALVWGGSVLAGRIKKIILENWDTALKTNRAAKKVMVPVEEVVLVPLKDKSKRPRGEPDFFDATILSINSIIKGSTIESIADTLFDSKEIPDQAIEFMKNITLEDIEFQDVDVMDTFKIVNQNDPDSFLEFSNRIPLKEELRGVILRDKIIAKRNEDEGGNTTLYDAILEWVSSPLETDIYTGYKTIINTYYEIDEGKIDQFALEIHDLIKNGEDVDVERAKEVFKDLFPTEGIAKL